VNHWRILIYSKEYVFNLIEINYVKLITLVSGKLYNFIHNTF